MAAIFAWMLSIQTTIQLIESVSTVIVSITSPTFMYTDTISAKNGRFSSVQHDGQATQQTARQIVRRTVRQTDGWVDKQTDRQTDRTQSVQSGSATVVQDRQFEKLLCLSVENNPSQTTQFSHGCFFWIYSISVMFLLFALRCKDLHWEVTIRWWQTVHYSRKFEFLGDPQP